MIAYSAAPSDVSQPTVFVVEDDEFIAHLLRTMLERNGYTVHMARDGREGQGMIDTLPAPSVAVLDVMLPFVDGLQLVRHLRARPSWRDVPVLMLTAKTKERDIVAALDGGADDYVVKPFQTDELLARLRRLARSAR